MAIRGSDLKLRIDDIDEMYEPVHALASKLRLRIVHLLSVSGSLYINEIADSLHVPPSTVALNVRVLEEAGIIVTEVQPGTRGGVRRCSIVVADISLTLGTSKKKRSHERVIEMPVGGYTECSILPVCGILGREGVIGQVHQASAFYDPERFSAQLLWCTQGYFEYRFPSPLAEHSALEALELSFEACSEAPHYCDDWPSDISVWINGVELGVWRSPGDLGGRRGNYTPEWWPTDSTQFGMLKTWTVTDQGSALDGKRLSEVKLADLNLKGEQYIRVRIGIDQNARHIGGINLFGEAFGDYPQAIRLIFRYRET